MHHYLVIGLGKTGFSVACFLSKQGLDFSVVDNRDNPPCLKEFQTIFPDKTVKTGAWDIALFQKADSIIVSPGLDPAALPIPPGKALFGDIELFARFAKAPVVAITGTNGKSTVTTLLGLMLEKAGFRVGVGGNLGTPALDLLTMPEPDIYVLELSSYQLGTTASLHPRVAVVLNFSPDHQDRYHDVDDYLRDKQKIYNHCEHAVINGREPFIWESLSLKNPIDFQQTLLPVTEQEMGIVGSHNVENAKAATAMARCLRVDDTVIAKTLKTFTGLSHRCQWVADKQGIKWFNDSKGTNVGATLAAIHGLVPAVVAPGTLILIAGGVSKGQDFSPLVSIIHQYVKHVILIGEAAPMIAALLPPERYAHAFSMENAVNLARELARSGDCVLLSPACASFDQFRDYQHRGDVFMHCVRQERMLQ
ncbi:MAG TPA: UDP-N-acetylmuramoyl-L-alanine--D-glutamate ligase [Coxiellaceae bacterium]|nr:UDP-N-acetylmuramoyl-L-alanine--D-glutamate ligase [Coxiellaceae bacterium]